MAVERREDGVTVRRRQRPRMIVLDPTQPPPAPPEQPLLPSDGEVYEFATQELPNEISYRIRWLARYAPDAAREEVVRAMAPFFMQGASATHIARVFNISIHTVPKWREQFREALRKEAVGKAVIEHYAESIGRLETFRRYLFGQLMEISGPQTGIDANTPANIANRRIMGKTSLVRALLDVEKVQLAVNTNFGIAKDDAFDKAKETATDEKAQANVLLNAAQEFMGEVSAFNDMGLDELSALLDEDDAAEEPDHKGPQIDGGGGYDDPE